MKIQHTSGTLKKFRRTPWRFQSTFETPLKDIQRFVSVISSSHLDLSGASLNIENTAFEPRHLLALLVTDSGSNTLRSDTAITTDSKGTAEALLTAALSDWIDFLFVPEPKPFVIYADHDEYCTFYANTRSNLNRVCTALSEAGFRVVNGYERS